MFYVDIGHFFNSFSVFFMFTVFGIPDIESRKKRNLLIGGHYTKYRLPSYECDT